MMKARLAVLILVLFSASCGTTRVTAVGGKSDHGGDVRPVEEQSVAGLEVSSVPEDGGLGFELGARYGRDTGVLAGVEYSAESFEYYAGPRYEWRLGNWSPFLSGGLTVLHGRAHSSLNEKFDESDTGYYGACGVDYLFASGWQLGGSIRKTVDLNGTYLGVEGDADAWQYLVRLGYAF